MTTHQWQHARKLTACCAMLSAVAGLASCSGGTAAGNSASTSSPGHPTSSISPRNPTSSSSSSGGGGKASPAKTAGIVQFALPPAGQGCAGAKRLPGGGTRFQVTVSTRQSQTAALANVCIDGKGPFPFVIDTGAEGSVLASSLAGKLGLPKIGAPVPIGGAGCSANARISRLASWDVAGLALQPQAVIYLKIPLFGGRGQPDGLLGSDVWSRFGAMRLDFARGRVTVPGPEHPGPARKTTIFGPSAAPVPAVLLQGKPAVVAPMRVTSAPGSTGITVKVRLGTHAPLNFTPDTGASQSAVDPGVARQAGLAIANARSGRAPSAPSRRSPRSGPGRGRSPGTRCRRRSPA